MKFRTCKYQLIKTHDYIFLSVHYSARVSNKASTNMHKTKHKERNLPIGFFSWTTLQAGKSERKQKQSGENQLGRKNTEKWKTNIHENIKNTKQITMTYHENINNKKQKSKLLHSTKNGQQGPKTQKNEKLTCMRTKRKHAWDEKKSKTSFVVEKMHNNKTKVEHDGNLAEERTKVKMEEMNDDTT